MNNNINQVILTALNLNVHFGEQIILENASLSIHEKDRIGLVGRNGAGKSTFLKIISGLMQPDSGNVSKKKDLDISFLSQEFTLDSNKTVKENILSGASKILTLLNEYENLPFNSPKKEIIEQKIIESDAWNIEKQIDVIIKSLNAPEKDLIINDLSGGEKRRVALCKALISKPDLLILDEPTNHLDTESIEWIENFLSAYNGTCIFVTHDRYFLDRIANRIVELSNGIFFSHHGNYTEFLLNKAEREAIKEKEELNRQNFLRRELKWIARGPKARTSKSKHRLDTFYNVASKEKFQKELDVEMIIPTPERLGKKILELTNVEMSFGERKLFDELNLKFEAGKTLGIVGKNGVGKTTLLKIILGQLKPTKGKIEIGENTSFNYIDQSRLILNDENTVIEAVSDGNDFVKFGNQQIKVWTYLKRFLFTDDRINTLVGRLSGGEKSRLTLARILKNGGNFLIFDEPTNDLDLPTLRILEETLINFEGCAIVVSHDRYFLNRVCDSILAFENNRIYLSEGNYDYYLEKKSGRLKNNTSNSNILRKKQISKKQKIRKLSWKEKKEIETIEDDILNAESEVQRLENLFAQNDFYEKYGDKIETLNNELQQAKEKVNALYLRWEELEEIKKEVETSLNK